MSKSASVYEETAGLMVAIMSLEIRGEHTKDRQNIYFNHGVGLLAEMMKKEGGKKTGVMGGISGLMRSAGAAINSKNLLASCVNKASNFKKSHDEIVLEAQETIIRIASDEYISSGQRKDIFRALVEFNTADKKANPLTTDFINNMAEKWGIDARSLEPDSSKSGKDEKESQQNLSTDIELGPVHSAALLYHLMNSADGDLDENEIKASAEKIAHWIDGASVQDGLKVYAQIVGLINENENFATENISKAMDILNEEMPQEARIGLVQDLMDLALVDGELHDDELEMFVHFASCLGVELPGSDNQGDGGSVPGASGETAVLGDTLLHLIFPLYLIIANKGNSEKYANEDITKAILSETMEWMDTGIAEKNKIMGEAQHWLAEVAKGSDDGSTMKHLAELLKEALPAQGLELVTVDLFTAAKCDGRYNDVPERKIGIEYLAIIMGVDIQYNGVGHGVHLIGGRAMQDFEGGIEELLLSGAFQGQENVPSTDETEGVPKQEQIGEIFEEETPKKESKPSKDKTKYVFAGKELAKARLVHAVVKQFCKDQSPSSFSEVQSAFPDGLQGSHGVVKRLEDALEIYERTGYKRFYIKPNEVLVAGNDNFATCNQWAATNITSFVNCALELGYEISSDDQH